MVLRLWLGSTTAMFTIVHVFYVPGFDREPIFLPCDVPCTVAESMKMLGVANDGRVYAIANYNASSVDEISFSAGDQLTVLLKGDEKETAWWWAVLPDGTKGYVPQNLLAVSCYCLLP